MKIVCIGDFHIPDRHQKIPAWITKKIEEEHPDKIVSPGDFTNEKTFSAVQKLGDLVGVKGNMDWIELPEHAVVEAGELKIGAFHGQGIVPRGDLVQLGKYAKRMKANILVHGHTHALSVEKKDGILFVNPGSATGSWGGSSEQGRESFIILETEGRKVRVRKLVKEGETEETHEL